MSLKVCNKPLNDLSIEDWKVILEHGSFRGYKINRFAQAFSAEKVDALSYNIGNGTVSYKGSYTLDLDRIKRCPSKWSFARLSYWFKKIFGADLSKHNSEIEHLAECLFDKLHSNSASPTQIDDVTPSCFLPNKDAVLIKNALVAANKVANDPEIFQMGEGIDSEMYAMWFNSDNNFIQIQKASEFANKTSDGKVTLQLDDSGQLIAAYIDDNKLNETNDLPEERKIWVQESYKKAIDLVSSYGLSKNKMFIEIKTVRRGIGKAPLTHLNRLGEEIQKGLKHQEYPRMDVNLLKNDLSKAKGSDNGGIARDYLNCVIGSTIKESGLLFHSINSTGLVLPSAKKSGDETFFLLSGEEMTVYQDLGKVMMYCYRSEPNTEDFKNNEYMMGQYFHESLFAAALSLTSNEIKTPFDSLGLEVKYKMCQAILPHLGKPNWNQFFDWDIGDPLPAFDNEALELAGDYLNDDCCSIDMDRANADLKAFMDHVKKNLVNYELGTGIKLNSLIAPIHAVAQGLKAVGDVHSNWNHYKGLDCIEFSNKVQGSLNRKDIVDAFTLKGWDDPEVSKKIKWLKEWIVSDKTSDKDLRAFLVYMTGSNALPNGQKLYYASQTEPNLVPTGITCNFTLLISPSKCTLGDDTDGNKEGFIKIIKKYIVDDTSQEITQD